MPVILHGDEVAKRILDQVRDVIKSSNCRPKLDMIVPTTDIFETPYYKGIVKDAEYCGVIFKHEKTANRSVMRNGAISLHCDTSVPEEFDLDGGNFVPCTVEAVLELFKRWDVQVEGKDVCIIGRSQRVGKPLADILMNRNATVTVCHSKTRDVLLHVMRADIVIGCCGDSNLFGGERIVCRPGSLIVDIGGEFKHADLDCGALIPFINGVGPVTRAVLMRHALQWYLPKGGRVE